MASATKSAGCFYSLSDLALRFGEPKTTIDRWARQGLLGRGFSFALLVPEEAVRGFIRQHADKYALTRVDQSWFRQTLFGQGRSKAGRKQKRSTVARRAARGGGR